MTAAEAAAAAGFTHVVWIPDSHTGKWEAGILADSRLTLVRPAREGEAVAIAAGLMLGGARPLVVVQITGFFEAGDAVRNVAWDLELPLKLLVGVRGSRAARAGKTGDTCPALAEPVVAAYNLPFAWFDPVDDGDPGPPFANLAAAAGPAVLLWAE